MPASKLKKLFRVTYPSIYLVALRSEKSSSFRVTTRVNGLPPKVVSFMGHHPLETTDETYGSLVIDENKWVEWYGTGPFMSGMETAAEAAETIVKHNADIYYGCPLCTARFKEAGEARAHIQDHVNKFISQFNIEVE